MQIGFNNDVEHEGTRYHVQTEDHGLADGRITSQVFRGGQILDTMSVSYAKAIEKLDDEEARDEEIRKRMKALHAHCFRKIKQGKYETKDEAASAATPEEDPLGATAESAPGAAILDKPKMPAEPAPAPGLARVRPLSGLRQPPPLPGDASADGFGDAGQHDLSRTVSDTAEDDAIPMPAGFEDLLSDDLAEAVAELADAADDEGVAYELDDELHDPTRQMAPLPDELPEGIIVAGNRSQLGEAYVSEHSRGEVMDLDALADDSSLGSSDPESSGLGRSRTRHKTRRFNPMYSPDRAFRGLDAEPDYALPALLERLARQGAAR